MDNKQTEEKNEGWLTKYAFVCIIPAGIFLIVIASSFPELMNDDGFVETSLVVLYVMALIYMMPWYFWVKYRKRGRFIIFLINLILGGTLIVWVIILVVALSTPKHG